MPASISLDVGDALDGNTVWYAYTPAANELQLSIFAWADPGVSVGYFPQWVTVYEGYANAAAGTAYLTFTGAETTYHSYLVPVDVGTTYYIRIKNKGGVSATTAVLELSVQVTQHAAMPAGSILVNDDTLGFDRAAVFSPVDGTVLRAVPFAPGEYADMLDDGTILTESVILDGNLRVYGSDLSLVATVPWMYTAYNPRIRGFGSTFYVLNIDPWSDDNGRTVYSVSKTGSIGATTWELPTHTDWSGVYLFAVSPDETVAYYDYYNWDTELYYIARYDLVNSQALTDLTALPTGSQPAVGNGSHPVEAFTLPDGSVFIATERPLAVLRYSSSGTLLNTYTLGLSDTINRISRGVDDTTFWVWGQAYPPYATSEFWEYDIATGALLTHFHVPLFLKGISGSEGGTLVTQPRFGISSSCPFLILRSSLVSPSTSPSASEEPGQDFDWNGDGTVRWGAGVVPGTPRLTRRLRQSPHLSAADAWLYYKHFQLDCETGVGNADEPAPQLMLQWSTDGGHTWSNEHWVSAGRQGEFRWRAIWRRLGRARDMTFRVVVSAPVKWTVCDAYVDVEQGLH